MIGEKLQLLLPGECVKTFCVALIENKCFFVDVSSNLSLLLCCCCYHVVLWRGESIIGPTHNAGNVLFVLTVAFC